MHFPGSDLRTNKYDKKAKNAFISKHITFKSSFNTLKPLRALLRD